MEKKRILEHSSGLRTQIIWAVWAISEARQHLQRSQPLDLFLNDSGYLSNVSHLSRGSETFLWGAYQDLASEDLRRSLNSQ